MCLAELKDNIPGGIYGHFEDNGGGPCPMYENDQTVCYIFWFLIYNFLESRRKEKN
jgi:hypothetical protein